MAAGGQAHGQHKLAPGVFAHVGADQAGIAPGLAAVNGDLDLLDSVHAAKRHALNLGHAGGTGRALAAGGVDPGLDTHLQHRGLVGAGLGAGGRDAVAVRHDAGVALGVGKGQALDVLDVVDAGVARHDEAKRAAMGQGDGGAVHFPGEHGVGQRSGGHRALDDDGFGVHALGQLFTAGAGHEGQRAIEAAQGLDHGAHGHAAPHHTAGSAHGPGCAAGLGGEKAPAVARALQHRHHGFKAHGFEFAHGELAGVFDAFQADLPGVAVGHDGRIGCGQIVADVELLGRGDDAGAKGAAPGLQRAAAVHDDAGRVFPVDVSRQRTHRRRDRNRGRCLGRCAPRETGQTGRSQCTQAGAEQAAAGQRGWAEVHG